MIQKTMLPFQLQEEKSNSSLTIFGGLIFWLELAKSCGLLKIIQKSLKIQSSNCYYSDASILFSLILLNLSGGESIEDIDRLESDGGLCKFFRRFIPNALNRIARKLFEKTSKSTRKRAFPSKSKIFFWLKNFHDKEKMINKENKTSFIPEENDRLKSLGEINKALCHFVHKKSPVNSVTLDMDATLIETNQRTAKYCYKGFSSYQPLNVWWAEQKMMLHSEFRDGNVPAGFEQLRVFKNAISLLPDEITKVDLRSDSAAYQWELLRYCERKEKEHPNLDIEFVVGTSVCKSMKEEISKVIEKDWDGFEENTENKTIKMKAYSKTRKYAELPYVPEGMGSFQKEEYYRYIVLREPIQTELPNTKEPDLPYPHVKIENKRYKVFVIITNKKGNAQDIIKWYFKRAGDSEHAHSILKSDLAGGRMPSNKFGVNAAWWQISIISLNLLAIMQQLVFEGKWKKKRLKAIRYWLIQIPARVIEHSRQLILKLVNNSISFDIWEKSRERIYEIREGT